MALLQNRSHRESVFASVFPVSSVVHTTPTPGATPEVGFSASNQPFGTPGNGKPAISSSPISPQRRSHIQADIDSIAAKTVLHDAAWSTATRFLTFPRQSPTRTREVTEALTVLLSCGNDYVEHVGSGSKREDWRKEHNLIEWYKAEVRRDYNDAESDSIQKLWNTSVECENAAQYIEETIRRLQLLQKKYLQPIIDDILPIVRKCHGPRNEFGYATSIMIMKQMQRDIQGMMVYSLPLPLVTKTFSYFLFSRACEYFGLKTTRAGGKYPLHSPRDSTSPYLEQMRAVCTGLRDIGFPQAPAERAFADAVDKLIDEYIASDCMSVDWEGKKAVTARLRKWTGKRLAPFADEILLCFASSSADRASKPSRGQVEAHQVKTWNHLAVWRLGKARVKDIFDYVLQWNQSLGAVLDLKEFIVTPTARSHLVQSFTSQLSRRLLQPAVPTISIIDFYIHSIRLFNELDPKGVLLDRVSRPLRRYLKERNDTARIIITSLLANVGDIDDGKVSAAQDISREIALEMNQPNLPNLHEFDHDLDWGNMDWSPEPVDAEPEYRKSKSEDVTASLLSLYDREDFIAELKNIFGEHLLKTPDSNFEKETRLLDLIKARLGDDKLQACEVMLRDIVDSKTINDEILSGMPIDDEEFDQETLVQILSRFFWPALHEESFKVPQRVYCQLQDFAEIYGERKKLRYLDFLPALGRAKVELELEDRTIDLEVQPAQASIIYAFQDFELRYAFDQSKPDEELDHFDPLRRRHLDPKFNYDRVFDSEPVHRTVAELVYTLQMDEALVRTSLTFWVGKMVLREAEPDTFYVIERLEDTQADKSGGVSADTATAAAEASAAAANAASATAVKSQEDVLLENMSLYSQFVVGMLTNHGSMPLAKIVMMLKMVVPGGFPFGPDEIKLLLQRLADEGKVVASGDVYGIAPVA